MYCQIIFLPLLMQMKWSLPTVVVALSLIHGTPALTGELAKACVGFKRKRAPTNAADLIERAFMGAPAFSYLFL